jgi:hypothetical protein
MKKYIILITTQIFLFNSLFVAPAFAGPKKGNEAAGEESEPHDLKIKRFFENNERMVQIIFANQIEFKFTETVLNQVIDSLKKQNVPKEKGTKLQDKQLAAIFGGYDLATAFGLLQQAGVTANPYGELAEQMKNAAKDKNEPKTELNDEGKKAAAKPKTFDNFTAGSIYDKVTGIKANRNSVVSKVTDVPTKNTVTGTIGNNAIAGTAAASTKGAFSAGSGQPVQGDLFTNNLDFSAKNAFGSTYQFQKPRVKYKSDVSNLVSAKISENGEPVSFRNTYSPEKTYGSGVDVDMSFSEADVDGDGKKETIAKAESVNIEQKNAQDRQLLHDTFDMNQIRKLLKQDRKDFLKAMIKSQIDQKTHGREATATAEWQKSIWGAQTRRFPMETIMFFFSIGLINGVMLTKDFSQNPLLMEQHLQTLTDPIGHISFYSFMIVNGYASEFLQNRMIGKQMTAEMMKSILQNPASKTMAYAYMKATDAATRERLLNALAGEAEKLADGPRKVNPYYNSVAKKAYMSMIPYLGMSAGSMASHFTGDYLRTLQSCATSFYKPPQPKEAAAAAAAGAAGQGQKMKDRLNGLSEDPCDVAWREWVMEKKFNTYSPALISMILSTMGSGAITSMFNKMKTSGPYKSVGEALSKTKSAIMGKLRLDAAELGTGLVTNLFGGVWSKGVKFVGHFTSITVFTALDTMIHSWVEDKVLNFNYGRYYLWPNIDAFPKKAQILDQLLYKEASEKFQKDTVACEKDIQSSDCARNDLEGWLYNFSQAMTKWREFNQTKAMQAHSQWVDKVNKFQNMERFSKSFYERFISDIKQVNLCRTNPETCNKIKGEQTDEEILEDLDTGALNTKIDLAFLNYRQYPLYGIEPDQSVDIPNRDKWKNNYIESPDLLQKAQQVTVHKMAAQFESYINRRGLDSDDLKGSKAQLLEIIAGLKSEDPFKNGHAINLMRSMESASSKQVGEIVQAILREHLNLLGYPAPLLHYGQGFPYAYEAHEANKDLIKDVTLPEFYRDIRLSSEFRFDKKSDYLMYHMLCGPNVEKGEQVTDGTLGNLFGYGMLGFRDLFIPPRLINDGVKLDICTEKMNFRNSSELYTHWIKDQAQGKKYAGAFNVIDSNLSDDMKSIINSTKFTPTKEEEENRKALLEQPMFNFALWWEKNVEKQVSNQLNKFKIQYEEIGVKFYEAQFKDVGTLLGLPIHSSVIQNSVVNSALQESRVYSLVLSEVLRRNIPADQLAKLYATNPQLQGYKNFKKQTAATEILSLQGRPFHQDLTALKNGTAPQLFKFQLINEEILADLYFALKKAEVVEKPFTDGKNRPVVDLKMDQKQVDALEKKIDEALKNFSTEIDNLIKLIPADAQSGKGERPRPQRIAEFAKTQMSRIARDLVATLSTIRFVHNASEAYTSKNSSAEDQVRQAERAQREQSKAKCIKTKQAAGIAGGGGC